MTKADIVSKISDKSGIEKTDVLATVEAFMKEVKGALESGENVYLRGFGSFIIKTRAEKLEEIFLKIRLSRFLLIIFQLLSLLRRLLKVLRTK